MTLSTLLILAVCRTRFIGTGGWLHCHLNAKGCASARDKCNLDPHCCPGRRGPASAGPNAFPGEILELKNKVKKKIRKDMNMYLLFVFVSESQNRLDSRREKCVLLPLEGRKVKRYQGVTPG